MNAPLVSIIIATYRRSEELRRAIDSAVKQNYKNCEIIVVDDNDSDEWNNTVEQIINDYTKDCRITLIKNHPNQGSAKARNIGIAASKGDYIVFLDDDDLFMPERVGSQLQKMIESKADYGITDIVLYNEDDTVNEVRKRNYLNTSEAEDLLLCHMKYHMTGTDTLMFTQSYLKKIGGFDPIDSGDEYYLMMKAITNNGLMCYLPQCEVKAYVHTGDGGLSSGKTKIEGEKKLYKYKKHFFDKIKPTDRRYITMRHYAVLAFAYLRMRNILGFLAYGSLGFCVSPSGCLKLIKSRKEA